MTRSIPRRGFHRATFLAAGAYNLAWAAWTALDPQWPFRLAGMAPSNRPEVFQTLAMVLGLYGLLYLEVARRPESGWPIAAVGFAGKVLGPVGFTVLLISGHWPLAAGAMLVTNDLIWWVPFAMYLRDAWPAYRAA